MTLTLILVNWGVFAYIFYFSGAPVHLTLRYGFIPREVFSHSFNLPAHWQSYLTIITANFLHGGLFHIAGNTIFLWVFGSITEDRMGPGKYLGFYLITGIISMLVQGYAFRDSTLAVVGASGAVAGVMGAYYILFPKARISTSFILFIREIPAIYYLFLWFLLNLVRGFFHLEGMMTDPVAWWAHIGGFLAGAVLVNLFATGGNEKPAGGKPKGLKKSTGKTKKAVRQGS